MKQVQLVTLKLRNFKGIKDFVLDAKGNNIKVLGDNGTGKTTLFDAFLWLLFDKDSQNKKDFQIKTLNAAGEVLHGLEHEVEGTLLINGASVALKKIYKEKWTKKRGSAEKQFTGNTVDYYIDDVPAKKKDFDEKVSDIVSEAIFKLLTSPSYFNDQLHWKDRRDILMEVCGGITDEEVIDNNKDLTQLSEMLNGKSIEDKRKIIAARRSSINKNLEVLPVRIDEVQRSIPDVSDLDEKELQSKIDSLRSKVEEKEAEISRIRNGSETSEKQKQLRETESALLDIKNKHNAENFDKVNEKRKKLNTLKADLGDIELKIQKAERQMRANLNEIDHLNRQREIFRNAWHEENNKAFEMSEPAQHDQNCPTCGQELPEEQLKAASEKAHEAFEKLKAEFKRQKSVDLETITERGKAAKNEVERLESDNEKLQAKAIDSKKELESKEQEIETAQIKLQELESNTTSVEQNADYQAKKTEKASIEAEISKIKDHVQESINQVQVELTEIKLEIRNLESDLLKFDQVAKSKKRIAELEYQEKELAAEFERLEQELYLTEEFIRTKVNLLEDKINSKFEFAKFKLFEEQVNGGLQETCVTLYKGVPYGSGLNNAASINIGLDIISTLSEHYGISVPVFIDNSESVTKLIEGNYQLISLVVSEKDKELKIEYPKLKEAI